ncbi:hypothetical protein [Profundibacter sp.]|uniref:hypothetical protein n=1 Tax=Profundibacter sp. TaxID=3101071 RepID=UPI003D0C42DF
MLRKTVLLVVAQATLSHASHHNLFLGYLGQPQAQISTNPRGFTFYALDVFRNLGLPAIPDSILLVYDADSPQIRVVFGNGYTPVQQHRIRAAMKQAALPLLRKFNAKNAHIYALTALLNELPDKLAGKSEPKFPPADRSPETATPPYYTWGAGVLIMLILGGGITWNYRKSTASRRARAARISTYKQRWWNKS